MTQRLLLSSQDRVSESTSSSDYYLNLVEPISGSYQLQHILIPNSFYSIVAGENDVIYFYDGSNRTATLTAGVYTTTTLIAEIDTQMDSAGANAHTTTYSATTQRITIGSASAETLLLSNALFTADRVIGFQSTTDTASATSHVGDSVPQLNRDVALLIRISGSRGETYLNPSVSAGGVFGDFLVPLDVGAGYYMSRNLNDFQQSIRFSHVRRILGLFRCFSLYAYLSRSYSIYESFQGVV